MVSFKNEVAKLMDGEFFWLLFKSYFANEYGACSPFKEKFGVFNYGSERAILGESRSCYDVTLKWDSLRSHLLLWKNGDLVHQKGLIESYWPQEK